MAVIETIKENNCLNKWLSEKYQGTREYAIGLKVATPREGSNLVKLYNIWEWAGFSSKAVTVSPTFPPPWNWEGGRGTGECATMIVSNTEQNGSWRRRSCTTEAVYAICERYK